MSALEVFDSFEKAARLAEEANSGCSLVKREKHIALSPKYIGRLRTGVHEILDAELGQFTESLNGVLLAYGNVKLLQSSGAIIDDSPFIHFDVKLEAVIFKPLIGSLLKCVVNEIACDHVGCLVHDWFNVSLLPGQAGIDEYSPPRLEPGYVVLVQVERLRQMNGMLAIEARAPDDGSDLILEAICLQSKDTDNESNSILQQPLISDTPDGLSTQKTPWMEASEKTKKKKKQKNDVDSIQELSHPDEPNNALTLQTSEESTRKKKLKKRKLLGLNEPIFNGQTPTGEETNNEIKKEKKKHIKMESTVDPNLDLIPQDPINEVVQTLTGEETNHKKKKKKHKQTRTLVDSVQLSLNPNVHDEVKTEEEEIPKEKRKSSTAADVVSDNPFAEDENPSLEKEFTKLKKKKSKCKLSDTTIDSSRNSLQLDSFGELPSSNNKAPVNKKSKKRMKKIKQDTNDNEFIMADSINVELNESIIGIKMEPSTENSVISQSSMTPGSDWQCSKKSHKKHKRKKADDEDCESPAANRTNREKKKKDKV